MNRTEDEPAVTESAKAPSVEESEDREEGPLEKLIRRVRTEGELFHSPDNEPYFSLPVDGHRKTFRIRDRSTGEWLAKLYFDDSGLAASEEIIRKAVLILSASAKYEGPQYPVYIRVGHNEGRIYIDLGNESWNCVEIDREGWRLLSKPPVKFRRSPGMLALPTPEPGGSIQPLRGLLNLDEDRFVLAASFLVQCFNPSGPYPILIFIGPQGAAKSTASKVSRKLVDPNVSPLRSEPKNIRDLMIAAKNGWCQVFDNVSRLPDSISDALCRLSTGGGFSTRQNYSDDEEMLFEARRPIVINGIEIGNLRPDLLDRAIVLTLSEISPGDRMTERIFGETVERETPKILGALFTAVSHALRRLPEVQIAELPRMADYIIFATAAEQALGFEDGAVLRAYRANRLAGRQLSLQDSPLVGPIQQLIANGPYSGTATELLNKLNWFVANIEGNDEDWPKGAKSLSQKLRRIASDLKAIGIEVKFDQTPGRGSRKPITLSRIP